LVKVVSKETISPALVTMRPVRGEPEGMTCFVRAEGGNGRDINRNPPWSGNRHVQQHCACFQTGTISRVGVARGATVLSRPTPEGGDPRSEAGRGSLPAPRLLEGSRWASGQWREAVASHLQGLIRACLAVARDGRGVARINEGVSTLRRMRRDVPATQILAKVWPVGAHLPRKGWWS
jgi:hypothetical protein